MKQQNRLLVLNLLRKAGSISRSDLARETGLAVSAVANVVNDLLAQGLVRQGEVAPSGGGRPPVLIEFNERSAAVIGINVGYTRVRGVLTDLNGGIMARSVWPTGDSKAADSVLQSVFAVVEKLKKQAGKSPVAGVGLGIPGLVDSKRAVSLFSPNLGWKDVPVGEQIAQQLGLPVLVDNDVRLATFGEWLYGAGAGVQEFAALFVGTGVGSGLVNGGALHYGGTGTAGEIGHTVVDPDGPRCNCGKYGCLEAMASGRAIAASAISAIKRGRESSLSSVVGGHLDEITSLLVAQEAEAGDALSREIMDRTGRYIGTAVAMLANIVNPKVVAVGGGVSGAGKLIFEPLQESFARFAVPSAAEETRILPTKLGKDAGPLGAAGRVVEQLFAATGSNEPGNIPSMVERGA